MARKDLAPSFSENHCGLLLYCMLGLDGWAFFILLLTIIFFWQWIVVTTVGSSEIMAHFCLIFFGLYWGYFVEDKRIEERSESRDGGYDR